MNGKFRVWDKIKKEWAAGAFYISENGQLWEFKTPNSDAPYLVTTSHKRYIVQFFTGLQDKNSQDIYDGDILKIEGKNICRVVWETPEFDVRPYITEECNGLQYSVIEGICEIIGNIFENPELLK